MTKINILRNLALRKEILEEAIRERRRQLVRLSHKSRAIQRSSAVGEFLRIYETQLGEVNRLLALIEGHKKDTEYVMFGCEELYDDVKKKLMGENNAGAGL